jgi:hypothetical protein
VVAVLAVLVVGYVYYLEIVTGFGARDHGPMRVAYAFGNDHEDGAGTACEDTRRKVRWARTFSVHNCNALITPLHA